MEKKYNPYAETNFYLFDWQENDGIVPRQNYWFLHDVEDEPTWFQIHLDQGCTVIPKSRSYPKGDDKRDKRAFVLHFRDTLIPRPFLEMRKHREIKVEYLTPMITSHYLNEASATHSVLTLWVRDDVDEISATNDSVPLVQVSWKN